MIAAGEADERVVVAVAVADVPGGDAVAAAFVVVVVVVVVVVAAAAVAVVFGVEVLECLNWN